MTPQRQQNPPPPLRGRVGWGVSRAAPQDSRSAPRAPTPPSLASPSRGEGREMTRRRALALLGAAALSAPVRAVAQTASKKPRRVAMLSPVADEVRFARLRAELLKFGYVEGRDIEFEIRTADGQFERMPALAAELAGDGKVDALIAVS